MSWLFPGRQSVAHDARFDAVTARFLASQRRLGAAADETAQAAEESREHIEAVSTGIKERSKRRLSQKKGYSRLLADGALELIAQRIARDAEGDDDDL